MQVPHAKNAIVDIQKLRDYCLDKDHSTGKHKARLFNSMLGMTAEDAEQLRQILLRIVGTQDAKETTEDDYGQRYRIDFELVWG